MSAGGYDIAHFRPEHLEEVLGVLSSLWRHDRETSRRLFRWKYLENPCAESALGIVALHRGRPVGFRGYFADRFTADGVSPDIGVLHPGDTVVAPEHRNQGLSVAMGRLASDYDRAPYRLFMSLSSSRHSLPGYLALRFRPLAKRVLLQRQGRNPFIWAVAAWSRRPERPGRPPAGTRIRSGRFGDLLVTDAPRPTEMADIAAAEPRDGQALRLRQDAGFFAWRYRNPVRRYAFYFRMAGETAQAFMAVDVSPDGRSGTILDYAEANPGGLAAVLDHVCASRDFVALSTLGYGVDARLGRLLAARRFTPVHTPQTLLKRGSVEALAPPVLIRPIAQAFGDDSFRVGALEMRRPGDWRLKPICSDGA
jgi:GNAT superfamily N-acetyltransferase